MAQLECAGQRETVQRLSDRLPPEEAEAIDLRRRSRTSQQAATAVRLASDIEIAQDRAREEAATDMAALEEDFACQRDKSAVHILRSWLLQMATSARIVRHCTEGIAESADLHEMARAAIMQSDAMKAAMDCWYEGWLHVAEELDRLNRRLDAKATS